jgi:hypothetical protein
MKTVSPYLSAEVLGLKEPHRQALIGLAGDLANHRIPDDQWQITSWDKCICGHLVKRTGVKSRHEFVEESTILNLFTCYNRAQRTWDISQEQAGQAAYNYLTVGKPCWDEVLS